MIINQIVDRRSSSKRPTGMLTNSNMEEMTKLLGERVMDRMRPGNSLWVIFNWDSYRSRVTGKVLIPVSGGILRHNSTLSNDDENC